MKIGVIGATGNVGKRVLNEAIFRGHKILAFTRDASRLSEAERLDDNIEWKELDVLNASSISPMISSLDVLISLFQPGNAAKDFNDVVQSSIRNPSVYSTVAKNLLKAMEPYPRLRLIVLGGAGSLEIGPGFTTADQTDEELGEALNKLGIPPEYSVAVKGHRDALNVYRLSNRQWTYLSPASYIYPGERTNRFRVGENKLITDCNGESKISYEDCAVAILDEIEVPRFLQRRFTIGY